jgi:hypothetical protein
MGVCTIKIVVLGTDDCPVVARAYGGPMCRSSSTEACTNDQGDVPAAGGVQQPATKSKIRGSLHQRHLTLFDRNVTASRQARSTS